MINELNKFTNRINTEKHQQPIVYFSPCHTIHKRHVLFFNRRRWKARISWSRVYWALPKSQWWGWMRRPKRWCRSGPSPQSRGGQPHPRASHWYVTLFTPFNMNHSVFRVFHRFCIHFIYSVCLYNESIEFGILILSW